MSGSKEGSLEEAKKHFYNGDFGNANVSLGIYYRQKAQNPLDASLKLAVEADQALCRFRSATNFELKRSVYYREAIIKNDSYILYLQQRGEKQSQNGNLDLIEKVLLASISAIWVHVSMDNIRMALYKAISILRWSASILSNSDFIHNRDEAQEIISSRVSPRTLEKFSHVLNVLDLLQEKDLHRLSQMNADAKKNHLKSLRLRQQEESVSMLAKIKLSVTNPDVPLINLGGIANKLQVIKKMMSEIPNSDGHNHEKTLREVTNRSNPSDLNLLGCFQFFNDANKALQSFRLALNKTQEDDRQLLCELISNIAVCYSNLEQHEKAKEILLWLINQNFTSTECRRRNVIKLSPSRLLRVEWLWRAFISATLVHDLRSTLTIAESLNIQEKSESTKLVYLFALAQIERSSVAHDHILRFFPNETNSPIWALDKTFCSMTDRKIDKTEGLMAIAERNNMGYMHLEHGNIEKALALFEKSISLSNTKKLFSENNYIHPYYNLTLLFLLTGNPRKALQIWLAARFPSLCQENLSQVKKRLDKAMNRYDNSTKSRQSDLWRIDGIGGMESRYVLLFDCLLLQQRLQELENEAFVAAIRCIRDISQEAD